MENRYATNPNEAKHYTTEDLRSNYLIQSLFQSDELKLIYSHEDRVVIGGVMPVNSSVSLTGEAFLKTDHFLERRELGIVNIGGPGLIETETESFKLDARDGLYIGKGVRKVEFSSKTMENPAKFYLVSTLAHTTFPSRKIDIREAEPVHLGTNEESNKRTIYKYIHADGVQSCQLMLGMTLLEPNNMWNTMPAHIHDRRMEVYLYFDMEENSRVFHFMGEPKETRHLVVGNDEALISPPWSIHSGVGTSRYSFIWAMAGENYTFTDMEFVPMEELR